MKAFRMALIAAGALAAVSLVPRDALADCQVGDCWGAVAFGEGGAWAYSVNESSREAASASAQAQCGSRCSNVLTFHNSCGAYASGDSAYGWGNASSREAAEDMALQQCSARTSNCDVRVWGCTTR